MKVTATAVSSPDWGSKLRCQRNATAAKSDGQIVTFEFSRGEMAAKLCFDQRQSRLNYSFCFDLEATTTAVSLILFVLFSPGATWRKTFF